MTFMEYAVALRRYWRLIVIVTILGAVGGYQFAASQTPIYESSTSVLVTSDVGDTGSDLVQGSTYVSNLVSSYAILATSPKVLDPVIDGLNLDTTAQALAKRVTAESPLNTVLIDLSVTDPDPAQAAKIADAVTASLSKAVKDVSPSIRDVPAIRLTTLKPAAVAHAPIKPNKKLLTLLGGLVGLVLGVGFALARRALGSAINDASDVARVTAVPVVGEIVEAKRGVTLPRAVLSNSLGVEAESLRGLTANLNFLGVDRGLRSIVLTSASPRESKSSVATSTALVLAEATHRVLLIDADLRASTIHLLTNLDNSIGLSNVLIGDHSLESAVQPWGQKGLDVLTSGPIPPNPGQLLSSEAMRVLIAKAESTYDFVILDSAPVLSVVDAVWLGHMVSGALVVARRGQTTSRSLGRALDTLSSSRTSVSGVVISRVPRASRSPYLAKATASTTPKDKE
jgi:succinoglycan biosynthesis transport protein ExoP